jgi:predicted nuclease of predicted toxin-antitoxin system
VLTGTDASAADLNRDGLVNAKDIAIWQRAQAAARKPMSAKSVDRD